MPNNKDKLSQLEDAFLMESDRIGKMYGFGTRENPMPEPIRKVKERIIGRRRLLDVPRPEGLKAPVKKTSAAEAISRLGEGAESVPNIPTPFGTSLRDLATGVLQAVNLPQAMSAAAVGDDVYRGKTEKEGVQRPVDYWSRVAENETFGQVLPSAKTPTITAGTGMVVPPGGPSMPEEMQLPEGYIDPLATTIALDPLNVLDLPALAGIRLASKAIRNSFKTATRTLKATGKKTATVADVIKAMPSDVQTDASRQLVSPRRQVTREGVVLSPGTSTGPKVKTTPDEFAAKLQKTHEGVRSRRSKYREEQKGQIIPTESDKAEELAKKAAVREGTERTGKERAERLAEEAAKKAEENLSKQKTPVAVKKTTVKKTKKPKDVSGIPNVRKFIRASGGLDDTGLAKYGISKAEDTEIYRAVNLATKKEGRKFVDDLGDELVGQGKLRALKDEPHGDTLVRYLRDNLDFEDAAKSGKVEIPDEEIAKMYSEAKKKGELGDNVDEDTFAKIANNDKPIEKVTADKLKPGDTFEVAGVKHTVKDTPGSKLAIVNGEKQLLDDTFDSVTMDKGSLKKSGPEKPKSLEAEFTKKQAAKGTDTRKPGELARREARQKRVESGKEDLFTVAEKKKQKDLFAKTPEKPKVANEAKLKSLHAFYVKQERAAAKASYETSGNKLVTPKGHKMLETRAFNRLKKEYFNSNPSHGDVEFLEWVNKQPSQAPVTAPKKKPAQKPKPTKKVAQAKPTAQKKVKSRGISTEDYTAVEKRVAGGQQANTKNLSDAQIKKLRDQGYSVKNPADLGGDKLYVISPTKTITGTDAVKGMLKAAGKDITNKNVGIVADPYSNMRKFLENNKIKLTQDEINSLGETMMSIIRLAKNNEDATVKASKYLRRKFPDAKYPTGEPIPRAPQGEVPLRPPEEVVEGVRKGRDRAEDIRKKKAKVLKRRLRDPNATLLNKYEPILRMERELSKAAGVNLEGILKTDTATSLFEGRAGKLETRLMEMSDIVEKVGDIDKFKDFMQFQRYIERDKLGLKNPGGVKFEEVRNTLEQMRVDDPVLYTKIESAATELKTFNDDLLDYYANSGMISKDSARHFKEQSDFYVPFKVLDYVEENADIYFKKNKGFVMQREDLIKKMKGTEREIGDVLVDYVEKMGRMVDNAERNTTAREVLKMRDDFLRNGLTEDEVDSFIRPLAEKQKAPFDMSEVSYFDEGVKYRFAVNRDVGDAMQNMGVEGLNNAMKMLAWGTKALRSGATLYNITFSMRNVVMDNIRASIISKYGMNPIAWGKGFAHVWKKDDLYKQFLESGASFSGFERRFAPDKIITEWEKRVISGGKTIRSKNPLDYIRKFNNLMEESTRVGVFEQAMKKSATPEEAAYWARNATVDFARMGNSMKVMNNLFPFLNARVQGTRNMALALVSKDMKKRSRAWAKAATIIGTPTVYLHYHNKGFPEYNKIPQYEKDKHFIVMLGTYLDKDGESMPKYARIPRSEIGALLGVPIERFLEYFSDKDPKAWHEAGKQFIQNDFGRLFEDNVVPVSSNIVGSLTPFLRVPSELASNYDFFRERQIVPEFTKTRKKAERRVPESIRYMTNAINSARRFSPFQLNKISPMQIEHAIYGTFASVGRHAFQLPNMFMGDDASLKKWETLSKVPPLDAFLGRQGLGEIEDDVRKYWPMKEEEKERKESKIDTALDIFEVIEKAKKPDRLKVAREAVKQHGPEMKKEVEKMLKDIGLGLTRRERYIKAYFREAPESLAHWVYDQVNDIDSKPKRVAKAKDLFSKKFISKKVERKLKELDFQKLIK